MTVYRAQVVVDGIEIEIEAPSLAELKKAIADAGGKTVSSGGRVSAARSTRKAALKGSPAKQQAASATRSPIEIVNTIKNDERWEDVEAKVLDNRGELPRILMVGFFAQKTEDLEITTADIDAVTGELGVRIRASNAATSFRGVPAGSLRRIGFASAGSKSATA